MNLPLLHQLQAHVLAHPDDLDMSTFTGCLAHWACVLGGVQPGNWRQTRENGADVLDLSRAQAGRLFFWGSWPEPFKSGYWHAGTAERRAIVAAGWIEAFVGLEAA